MSEHENQNASVESKTQITSLGAGSGHSTPFSYRIKNLDLYPQGITFEERDSFSLIPQAIHLNITEGIFQNSIHVSIGCIDAVGILEGLRICGGEKIKIHIEQRDLQVKPNKEETKEIELEVYISDIKKFGKLNTNVQNFVLECVTKPAYINQLTVLDKAFEKNPGGLIEDIAKDLEAEPFNLGYGVKDGYGEQMKGIYPKMRPFDAINWILRNAHDKSSPVFFYETLRYGFLLRSWDQLIHIDPQYAGDPYNNYPYPWNIDEKGEKITIEDPEHYNNTRKSIVKIKSFLGFSVYNKARKGAYASTSHVVDIPAKKYTEAHHKFEYKEIGEKLNEHNPFSTLAEFADGSFDKNKNSRHFFVSENTKAFGGKNYHSEVKNNVQKKEAIINNMHMMTHELTIPGDPKLFPGGVVELKLWKIQNSEDPNADEERVDGDKYMSGKFVVQQIMHQFKPEGYTMELQVIKDSSLLDFDEEKKA